MFKKKRIFIYIAFVIVTVAVLTFVIISKLSSNILIGKWISEDGQRQFLFDDNTLTITYSDLGFSKFYGYTNKDNSVLLISKETKTEQYEIKIQGDRIFIYSDDYDSPEILLRAYD